MKKQSYSPRIWVAILSMLIFFNALPICAFAEDLVTENENIEKNATLESIITASDIENVYNKIHFYFGDSDDATIDDMSELVKATNKLTESGVNLTAAQNSSGVALETVKITVQFESDFMSTPEYKAFEKERDEVNTIDEVHEFRERLNSFSKEYHNALVAKNISLLSELDYHSIEHIGYSPFVVVNIEANKVTADTLLLTAESEEIVSISVAGQEQPEETASWNDTLKGINAYDIVNNGTRTGKGIRIGIYESEGICDVSHVNLSNKNITLKDPTEVKDIHATQVASILATIAPDAIFYASKVKKSEIGIQWFVEMGCDIVNCSFGYPLNSVEYRLDVDGVYDYQVLAHFITVVVAAGNFISDPYALLYNPDRRVLSPGHAYNVITVGGVNRVFSPVSGYRVEYDSGASFFSVTPHVKPNVAAFHEVKIPNMDIDRGTSFAAPQVAGCIALLEEDDALLCLCPERVLSLVTSTAQKTDDYGEDIGYFSDKVGAGVLDLQRMIEGNNSNNQYYKVVTATGSGTSEIVSIDVNLQKGEKLQVGLAWLATAVNSSNAGVSISDVRVTDYNLRIYTPSGATVSSALTYSNVELIRLTASVSGNYRIIISRTGTIAGGTKGDRLSLTYNISK